MIMKIDKFNGVKELYALPSCLDMIDPFYSKGNSSKFASIGHDEQYEQYLKTREHVLHMRRLLEPTNSLFTIHSELFSLK